MEEIKLMQGDCLELMKGIPDGSIDLVVTDCPYTIVAGGVSGKRNDNCGGIFGKCSSRWVKKGQDDVLDAVRKGTLFKHNDLPFSAWLPEVYRVLKPGTHCYIFISGLHLKELQEAAEKAGFRFVNLLAWRKQNKTPNPNVDVYSESMVSRKKGEAYVKMLTHTYLRGTNLQNKVVILDESQNYTVAELKKVLTRCHDSCKVIVIGHNGQIDIRGGSGFAKYLEHFEGHEKCAVCKLTTNHRGWLSTYADQLEE